ncbi:DUF2292 domain-containing protein [Ectobacillus panaciterrae]|nr:DUF2292 domain-containing protein [Ectobacillus panaciterrae]
MVKLDDAKIDYILSLLEKINHGYVTITIHNEKITQIDINEKYRLLQK